MSLSDTKFLQKPRVILLDWDNTLVESQHIFEAVLQNVVSNLGLDSSFFDSEVFMKNRYGSVRDVFPQLFGDRCEEASAIHDDYISKIHLDQIRLIDGAKEFLQKMYIENIPMAIVSNKESKFLNDEIDKLKLRKYFYRAVGSGDASEDKPSTLPAYLALKGVEDNFDRGVWFIGDSIVDMICAVQGNFQPILFRGGINFCDDAIAESNIKHVEVKDFKKLFELYKSN